MKKLFKALAFIICLPIIASIIIKPYQTDNQEEENDTDVIIFPFTVMIKDDKGSYEYTPENIIPYMVNALTPWDSLAEFEDTVDPEAKRQEYLKALSIVCRTNLVCIWEQRGRPLQLDIRGSGLCIKDFGAPSQFDEAKKAALATFGAVITDADSEKGTVIAAPFYTTSDWDMKIGVAGSGDGLSINYAAMLAKEGKDFYYILNCFYENIRINIPTGN